LEKPKSASEEAEETNDEPKWAVTSRFFRGEPLFRTVRRRRLFDGRTNWRSG